MKTPEEFANALHAALRLSSAGIISVLSDATRLIAARDAEAAAEARARAIEECAKLRIKFVYNPGYYCHGELTSTVNTGETENLHAERVRALAGPARGEG